MARIKPQLSWLPRTDKKPKKSKCKLTKSLLSVTKAGFLCFIIKLRICAEISGAVSLLRLAPLGLLPSICSCKMRRRCSKRLSQKDPGYTVRQRYSPRLYQKVQWHKTCVWGIALRLSLGSILRQEKLQTVGFGSVALLAALGPAVNITHTGSCESRIHSRLKVIVAHLGYEFPDDDSVRIQH